MKPPDNAKGDCLSVAAPRKTLARGFDSSSSVKAGQMAAWLDDAIAMCRKAASDPVEYQRLGIWLQRMRRAVK